MRVIIEIELVQWYFFLINMMSKAYIQDVVAFLKEEGVDVYVDWMDPYMLIQMQLIQNGLTGN